MTAAWILASLLAADAGAPGGVEGESAPAAASAPAATPGPAASDKGGARAKSRAEHAQALALLRAGRLGEAVALFARAAEHDPGSSAIATDYGFALGRIGKRAEAEAVLRGAIEKDAKRVYAYVNLADLLTTDPGRWERRDAVIGFLEKGLETFKDDRKHRFTLLVSLAGFERTVGRTAAARARLAPLLAPESPPLARVQRKRVLDLLDAIALDERAFALEDWPAPAPKLAREHVERARAHEVAGRVDEAARDLEIAVNLAPSDAAAWRALGRLLGEHGGALELERADEALRQALTLEPAWSDLRALRARIQRRRSINSNSAGATAAAQGAPAPSEKARRLYQEAEDWIELGDPIGAGRELLEQALGDSPGFVAAAISLYALTGSISQATIDALQDDGPELWRLASGVRKLGRATGKPGTPDRAAPSGNDDLDLLVRPLVDRAVELDVQEARFARAVTRAAADDRAGALADLVAYIAREPRPEHLAEARALRAGLGDRGGATGGRVARVLPSALLARIRLLEDRPDAALRALGGTCVAGLGDNTPDAINRLVAIGLVHEYSDEREAARACYEVAAGESGELVTLTRLARLDARLSDKELAKADRRPLIRAAAGRIAAAEWALARLAMAAGDDASALSRTERSLELAAASATEADVWLGDARATARRLSDARRAATRVTTERRRWGGLGGALLVAIALAFLARRRWTERTVEAALRRRPSLFPEVARAIGELRHDVLKHRAGVLGAAGDEGARADVARALLEPRPTSAVVASIYDRLMQTARGVGLTLRPLGREPVFGAIARDLARAETLVLARDNPAITELLSIDERLRTTHADALAELLQLGPRTRVDAAALSTWIAALEASVRQAGHAWTAPGLSLADLAVDFPVEEDALEAVFSNLLRNAQSAVRGQDDARVIVRVDRERDVTGRQQVTIYVGDSATTALTLEAIEARESGRGLAIVRDLVRAWRGHIIVRPEPAPLSKLVGAAFPL